MNKIKLNYLNRVGIFILTALAIVFVSSYETSAQAPTLRVHLSYQAENLAPPSYLKHATPLLTPGSRASVSATVYRVSPEGVITILNPNLYRYQWFHNGHYVSSGRAAASASISIQRRAQNTQNVLLRLSDLNGNLIQAVTLSIPLGAPAVTIVRQFPDSIASAASPIRAVPGSVVDLKAVPHFFSVGNSALLTFRWSAHGREIAAHAQNPNILRVNIPTDALRQEAIPYSVLVSSTIIRRGVIESAEGVATVQVE